MYPKYCESERDLVLTASVQVETVADEINKPSIMLIATFQKHDSASAQ
jgi:hypothetical protein